MRIDVGLVVAVILEYIAFIYYSNTLFYRKTGKLFFGVTVSVGYIIHFFACVFGNVTINTLTFFLLNTTVLMLCFYISRKTAVFQGIILVILSAVCELIAIYVGKMGISAGNINDISAVQSIILTLYGKSLYLTGIMVLTQIFKKKSKYMDIYSVLLILIPILTLLILLMIIKMPTDNYLQLSICIICIAIDVTVFIINQNIVAKTLENEVLRLQAQKDEKEFEDFMAIKHLRHDMDEHLEVLYSLIDSDNKQAKEYIKSLNSKNRQLTNIIDYTDNHMINVVLSKKTEECKEQGITFSLDPIRASMKFFKNMDAVTVFSNLINNAMESCKQSVEKKIYMRIYTVNKNFVVIKTENSSDKKPLVIDGKLKTHKDNEFFHGIGISSIKQTIKAYNGTFSWTYDEKEKIFCSEIVIQHIDSDVAKRNKTVKNSSKTNFFNHSGAITTTR